MYSQIGTCLIAKSPRSADPDQPRCIHPQTFFYCDTPAVTILLPTTYDAISATRANHVIHVCSLPAMPGPTDFAQPAFNDQPHAT